MLSDIPKIARNEISVTKCKEYCAIWLKICFWIDTQKRNSNNIKLNTWAGLYNCITPIIKLFNKGLK
jgi:hypothetical protein